jgi:long-subunit acyl-CoA synthetase (AMP-forming)
MEYTSPVGMLYKWEKEKPGKVFLSQPINDIWHKWTWASAAKEVRSMAADLKARNFPPGSHIALISKNCAHWLLADLAIMMAGHVSIPLYPNLHKDTIRQILDHSESKLLFVGKLDDWSSMKPGVPEGLPCISFPFYSYSEYEQWEDIISRNPQVEGNPDRAPEEIATIIYTSGTTGAPKGVMHSFYNLFFTLANAIPHLGFGADSRFFSYLPLSHIAERLLVELGALYTGGEIYFTESLEKFPKNLATAEPTVFFAVQRIWKKFQEGILEKIPQKKLNVLLKIPILSSLVRKKIKKGLGLAKAKSIFTGASPTPASLIEWFSSIGIQIQEAYGLTENCIYSNVTLKSRIKPGFVGKPFPLSEIRLGEQNEIQIRHAALMKGYYKEPQKTSEAFSDDGFLRTGDEGFIDEEGFLKITGRIKELFKTSKGKYVAPSPIEMKISANPDLEWVCVVGSGLPQPMALVILSDKGRNKTRKEFHDECQHMIHEVNISLDAHEHIARIIILNDEWTVENGILTPSLKIRRNEVERKYSVLYESWYSERGPLIWAD